MILLYYIYTNILSYSYNNYYFLSPKDLKVVNLRKSEHNEDSEHFHEFFESFVNICCLFMWSDIM